MRDCFNYIPSLPGNLFRVNHAAFTSQSIKNCKQTPAGNAYAPTFSHTFMHILLHTGFGGRKRWNKLILHIINYYYALLFMIILFYILPYCYIERWTVLCCLYNNNSFGMSSWQLFHSQLRVLLHTGVNTKKCSKKRNPRFPTSKAFPRLHGWRWAAWNQCLQVPK